MIGKTTFLIVCLLVLTNSVQGRPLSMVDNLWSFHGDKNQQERKLSQVEHHLSDEQKGVTWSSDLRPDVFDGDDVSELNLKIPRVKKYLSVVVKSEVRISLYRDNEEKYLDGGNFVDRDRYNENENDDDSNDVYKEEKEDENDDNDDDHEKKFHADNNSGENFDDISSASAVYKCLFDDNDKNDDDKPIVYESQDYDKLFDDILDSNKRF